MVEKAAFVAIVSSRHSEPKQRSQMARGVPQRFYVFISMTYMDRAGFRIVSTVAIKRQ